MWVSVHCYLQSACDCKWVHMPSLQVPRCYTKEFCEQLLECYENRASITGDLRHKEAIDFRFTDRELFSQLPTNDIVLDGKIHEVWNYLYSCKYLKIPETWSSTMSAFHAEVQRLVAWQQLVLEQGIWSS